MAKERIKKQAILPRVSGIQSGVEKLRTLSQLSLEEFSLEDNFVKAQFYLRRALEGIFHIGTHVLSRVPGGRVAEYKAIALKLGEVGIVPKAYAENQLKAMAGYRNRLTHFYADITPAEIREIIRNHAGDIDVFLRAIKDLLTDPARFNFELE